MGSTGLTLDILDVDKFISLNKLVPCENPIFLDRNMPTRDGVLSYEIFGTSQEERRNRFAYIDLHQHYMHPLAATKLGAYDRTLSKLLFSNNTFFIHTLLSLYGNSFLSGVNCHIILLLM